MTIPSNDRTLQLSKDVYSSAQVESKLWLCRQIEKQLQDEPEQIIWILGGWCGLLSFLLLSRERLKIKTIRSFDRDPLVEKQAYMINETWNWAECYKFQARTIDCNELNYSDLFFADSEEPTLIINTSVEHFDSDKWYTNIPNGKKIVLQSCDLQHEEHVNCVFSEEEFKNQFQFRKLHYSGHITFNYKTHSLTRYMLIIEK